MYSRFADADGQNPLLSDVSWPSAGPSGGSPQVYTPEALAGFRKLVTTRHSESGLQRRHLAKDPPDPDGAATTLYRFHSGGDCQPDSGYMVCLFLHLGSASGRADLGETSSCRLSVAAVTDHECLTTTVGFLDCLAGNHGQYLFFLDLGSSTVTSGRWAHWTAAALNPDAVVGQRERNEGYMPRPANQLPIQTGQ